MSHPYSTGHRGWFWENGRRAGHREAPPAILELRGRERVDDHAFCASALSFGVLDAGWCESYPRSHLLRQRAEHARDRPHRPWCDVWLRQVLSGSQECRRKAHHGLRGLRNRRQVRQEPCSVLPSHPPRPHLRGVQELDEDLDRRLPGGLLLQTTGRCTDAKEIRKRDHLPLRLPLGRGAAAHIRGPTERGEAAPYGVWR